MEVKVFNYSEKKFEVAQLESSVWSYKFSPLLISLYNRYNLLNKRNVISKTKNKANVSGGGAKPWAQKGTGRARQGSIRSPQWKGGGVVFGPTGNQNYTVEMNKKEKRKALSSILSKKLSLGEVVIVENIIFDSYKTKDAVSFINSIKGTMKTVLFITSLLEDKNDNIQKSFRNIEKVLLKNSRRLNVYDILKSNLVIFTRDSLLEVENRLLDLDNK